MTFRAQAIVDLSTFLNVDEFGDNILIDGDPVACVLVDDELPEGGDGVIERGTNLYVKEADFYRAIGSRQRLAIRHQDVDRLADVVRVDVEQGLRVLRLRWFDS